MGLRASSGRGATTKPDLGKWLVNIGWVSLCRGVCLAQFHLVGRSSLSFQCVIINNLAGLENIFLLVMRKNNELRVDMEDWEGAKAFAHYASFSIDSENNGYQLHLGRFLDGNAGEVPINTCKTSRSVGPP